MNCLENVKTAENKSKIQNYTLSNFLSYWSTKKINYIIINNITIILSVVTYSSLTELSLKM